MILERYRSAAHAWPGLARNTRREVDPMAHFVEQVDRLFYLAAAVLGVCILLLLFDWPAL